jgi:hypothetical protein
VGSIKKGDKVIVTDVLYIQIESKYSFKAKDLISSVHKVLEVDTTGAPYPYKIEVDNSTFWVEGIPYSSLMMELI